MRTESRRGFRLLIWARVTFCLFPCLAFDAAAHAGAPAVRVAFYDYPPLACVTHPDSDHSILVKTLSDIAASENWSIAWVPGSMSECIQRLETQAVDLMIAAPFTAENQEKFSFSRETAISTWAEVYTAPGRKLTSILDIDGLSVGCVAGDVYNPQIRALLQALNLQCNIIEFKDYADVFHAIGNGWIDAGVVDRLYGAINSADLPVRKSAIVLAPVEHRFAVLRGTDLTLIAAIDYHLRLIKQDPNSGYHQLYERFLNPRDDPPMLQYLMWGLALALGILSMLLLATLVLRNQVRARTRQLSHQKEYLLALHDTTLGIIRHQESDVILERIITQAAQLVEAECGMIYLHDPASEKLELRARLGVSEAEAGRYRLPGEGLFGRVWKLNQPMRIQQYGEWADRLAGSFGDRICSAMGVTLRSGHSPVGVMGVARYKPKPAFSEEDLNILNHFAELASIAMENAWLYKEIESELGQRKKAELALRESTVRLQHILDSVSAGIIIIRNDTRRITYANPAAADLIGLARTALIGESCRRFLCHSDASCPLQANQPSPAHAECQILSADDVIIPILKTVCPITFGEEDSVIETFFDLRPIKAEAQKRRDLEVQLQQAQKMQSIGVLAGGIAHDFNNILSPILGYTEMAMMSLPPERPETSYLKKVEIAAHRARDLVQQILTFSRQGDHEDQDIIIQPVIKEAIKLLASSLPSTIRIQSFIATDPIAMRGNPTQIHQVVMNLCTNAYHAMRQQGGVLTIRMECEGETPAESVILPQPHFVLTVSDTGSGMDESVRSRIFEPYFTTKGQGEGSGLGLAVVHGIVSRYQGHIEVKSEPGKGTCFRIWFPRLADGAVSPPSDADSLRPEIVRAQGRVLLVDDEEPVNEVQKTMLSLMGYHVSAFRDSRMALHAFRKNPEAFDVIVTDMTMPNMTGAELSKKILQIRPDIPIILCSGFSDIITSEQAIGMGIAAYLQKPFRTRQLADAVQQVLAPAA